MIELHLAVSAFIAGILTFLAPCTLPLVPGYLSLISGVSTDETEDEEKLSGARRTIFLNGLMYVIGFSAVFIFFGTLAGFAGAALAPWRLWLTRIGGAFVIFFGLFMLGAVRFQFFIKERQLRIPLLAKGKLSNSLILGSAFGFGWTPCVGPILASILLLASTTATVFEGALLLFIFSLGLAIPFLLIALGIGRAVEVIRRITPLLNAINVIGGIFLIFLGILLITGKFTLLISYGYRLFQFINYERLLDYL